MLPRFSQMFWRSLCLLLSLIFLASPAQAVTYNLSFAGGVNVAGGSACGTVTSTSGSGCRFSNVVVGAGTGAANSLQRDAIITVTKLSGGATVATTTTGVNPFDNDSLQLTLSNGSTGAARADMFAPTVTAPATAGATSYAEFTVQFVLPGTSTISPLPGNFYMTSFDTDGSGATNGLREFIEFTAPSGSGLTSSSSVQAGTAQNGGVNYIATTSNNQPGVGDGDAYKASARYTDPGTVKFTVGAVQGTAACSGGSCARLSAYSFQVSESVYAAYDINGYKTAKLTTDANGNGLVDAGDTVTYTVTYVNTGNAAATISQITDVLPSGVSVTTGAQTVRIGGTVTASAKNSVYNGTNTTGLLGAAQTLASGSTVSIDIPVVVGSQVGGMTLSNQATATVAGASVASDNLDSASTVPPTVAASTGWPGAAGSIVQPTQTTALDPTTFAVVNRPPTSTNVINAVLLDTAVASTLSAGLSATDPDGTIASYTVVTLPAAAQGVLRLSGAVVTAGQVLTPTQAAQLTFKPAVGFNGSATFTYSATDNAGASSNTATYTVPVNVAPVAVNDAATTPTNTAVSFSVVANDTDTAPGTVNAAAVDLNPSTPALDTSFTVVGQGTFTVNASGVVSFIPVTGFAGTVSIPYTVQDNQGATSNTATITVTVTLSLFGTVFEDFNYGGGAGRAYTAGQGMSLRPGVRVELYTGAGAFVSATLTDTSGAYSFTTLAANTAYKVRVVSSFVTSSRGGGCAPSTALATAPTCAQVPVQTYVNGDVNRVGGENPGVADPALSTGTLPANALSVASVTLASANVTGVDFGFNFDTVVNTNASGQGSLSQFLTNAAALSNTDLAQKGSRQNMGVTQALPDGVETSIFMISDGAAHPGLRAGLPNLLTGGVAVITPTSLLPVLSGSNAAATSVDGTTQTVNVGDTNGGTLGTGGTVGYINTSTLDTVQRPEVQIVGRNTLVVGLDLRTDNTQVRGLSIYGFGNAANNDGSANIRIGSAANSNYIGTVIEQNIVGAPATSFPCGGSNTTALTNADNIRSVGSDSGTVQNNLIGCAAGKGIGLEKDAVSWLLLNNEIRGNGIGNTNLDGIDLENTGTKANTVRGNLIADNAGVGVDGYQGGGSNVIERNTITGNGRGVGGVPGEIPGIRVYSSSNTVQHNVISGNYGAGVMVINGYSGNRISQNSIYDNGSVTASNGAAASGQIGIDLLASTDSANTGTAPFVTKNDSGDPDAGGNDLLNFPVFSTAQIVGGNLQVTGYARAGSTIELFIAAVDPSGFGEGKTYLTTLTEGSAADTDSGTGTYVDSNAGTDNTSRFSFSVPLPAGVGVGTRLTATATCLASACVGTTVTANSTSEFSYNIAVTAQPPNITLLKLARNTLAGSFSDATISAKPGETVEYCIAYTNTGGAASNFVLTDYVPVGMVAQLAAYGTSGPNQTGDQLGLKYAVGVALAVNDANSNAVTPALTSRSGDDAGTLTNAPVTRPNETAPVYPGVMTLTLPTVAANSKGTVCFQAKVP